MSKNNNFVFTGLHVIAWIIFVGLCVEVGGLIVNFVFSMLNPEMVSRLYQNLDLSLMYEQSPWAYFSMYSFIIFIALLKALLFYYLIVLLYKLDLSKPFSSFAAHKIMDISHITFSVGILSLVARQTAKNLTRFGYDTDTLNQFWVDSQAFILMAAVIYVIAAIFKKGTDLQTEIELTV